MTESDEHISYWQQQLAGPPPALALPFDYPRPPVPSFIRASVSIVLERDLGSRLTAISGKRNVDPSTILFTALRTVLFRYSGQDDCLLWYMGQSGAAPALPPRLFPYRSAVDGQSSGDELIKQTVELLAQMSEHSSISLSSLAKLVPLDSDGGIPTINSAFVSHGSSRHSAVEAEGFLNDCDIVVAAEVTDGEFRLSCQYDEELFSEATMVRMLGHLRTALAGILASPQTLIPHLPIATEAEREDLLLKWNQTQRDYPTDACLHELFEQQVARSPDAVALIYDEQELTYSQLNSRANQLAHFLRDHDVKPDTRVGVFMHRGLDMVVSLYAILKAGGAYVPLDPDYPTERLAFMLQDSSCDLLLIQKDLDGSVPAENRVRTIAVDDQWSMIAESSARNPSRIAGPRDLAYVIYTSGSTGKPKGVMNEHVGICNRLFWMQDAFELNDDDRVLQKTPFSFDVSVWEFFWPLLFGAKLVIARPDGHRDPDYLVGLIEKRKVTTMHFVPSMLQAFLRTDDLGACSCLRRVICSGEALSYDLQEMFFQRLDAELHNLYGPTEAAVDVTHWACRRSDERHIVPIGKPISNTQIFVLDAALNPIPVGMVGELHIGGVQVARGYLNRPDLTAEKFIRDPFVDSPSARLYKTGDLARLLSDGNVEYLGRSDHQVKIRGFRIELNEIETVLGGHPSVRECVVIAREDTPGDKRLTAYVVRNAQSPKGSVSELRRHLQLRMPEYMVPATFVWMAKLPLTNNGKVDRKALPAPNTDRPELDDNYLAPRTSAEKTLSDIWEKELRIERVGINDNYFDLGGDSLLLTRIHKDMQQVLGADFSLVALFQYPTIRLLAQHLSGNGEESDRAADVRSRAQRQRNALGQVRNRIRQQGNQ